MPKQLIVTRKLDDELERGMLNLETGEFPMTLATDGEASDGHILNIDGAVTQPRMPLLFNHWSSEQIPALGSVIEPRKDGGRLRATGRINMNGEGQLAEIRTGIAQLVADGDLRAVSVRWEGLKQTPRTALPESHPHYIKPGTGGPREWGMYFEKFRVLEGSVVSLGADPKALIGRATTDAMRAALRLATAEPALATEPHRALLEDLADWVAHAREAGMTDSDLANGIAGHLSEELMDYHFTGGRLLLPRPAFDALRGESLDELRLALALRKHAEDPERELEVEISEQSKPAPAPPERKPAVRTVADLPAAEFAGLISTGLARAVEDAVRRATGRLR